MKVFASMDAALPLDQVATYAGRVEALGYDGIHVAETVHDVFLAALLAIQGSERLTVRTSVAVAFPRSPMVVALAAWDLSRLSGGRFDLGLGTQVKANLEGRYSTAWAPPVSRMREYVESLRAIWQAFQTGERLSYTGEHYQFSRLQPYFNPGPLDHPAPKVLLGGVNPAMCTMAGEVADGLVTHPTSAVPPVLERISDDLAGRAMLVASTQFCSGQDDATLAREREDKRRLLAFLYSTPAYRPALEAIGFGDRADRLHAMSRAQQWDALDAVVDDALLDAVAPSATYAALPALLRTRFAMADQLVVTPPADPADDAAFVSVVRELQAP